MSDSQNPVTPPERRATEASDAVELLSLIGTALYGTQWQEDIGRALGVSGRSVRYWVAGRYPVPIGVWADLRQLMRERRADLAELIRKIPGG